MMGYVLFMSFLLLILIYLQYIQWISDNKKAWHVTSQSFPADPIAQISARPIPNEPLYILVNLGMSKGFIPEPNPNLKYPSTMYVDWIRVYQPKGKQNVGCSPKDMPTAEYINKYDNHP
jgi:beta-glucanase (GH16 family)